jgi:HK97 family phage major capsid protein
MSDHGVSTITELLREMKSAQDEIMRADAERVRKLEAKADKAEVQRVSDTIAGKVRELQTAVDNLSRKVGRPSGGLGDFSPDANQAAALGLLEIKHALRIPKADPEHPYNPSADEVDEAAVACRAMKHLLKVTSIDILGMAERKALSAFALGSSGFLLPPEWSSQILSCLEEKTDVTGWMNNITISGSSLKMFVDNADFDHAMWACEGDCFGAKRIQNITEGLGEIEIKPEELRYIVCCTRDIIEDSSVDIERWLFEKVSMAFRNTISTAVFSGDGIGKPQGIIHPSSGIPICDTSANTPANTFTWQDLLMLKWEVPVQFHTPESSYAMNQRTFALTLTMSDANGRPIMLPSPVAPGAYLINGSPVYLATLFPDVAPGAVPVAFGNWKKTYTIATRRGITWQADPFSAGFCVLQKFSARVGGGVTCPNAARLLRTK